MLPLANQHGVHILPADRFVPNKLDDDATVQQRTLAQLHKQRRPKQHTMQPLTPGRGLMMML